MKKSQENSNEGKGPGQLIAPARVTAQAINVFSKCSQSEVSSV